MTLESGHPAAAQPHVVTGVTMEAGRSTSKIASRRSDRVARKNLALIGGPVVGRDRSTWCGHSASDRSEMSGEPSRPVQPLDELSVTVPPRVGMSGCYVG